MGSFEQEGEQKPRNFGIPVSCLIGAAIWWFLSGQPSTVALTLAAFLLGFLFMGYCLLAILLPGPDQEPRKETFTPLPQSDANRPKALTH